MGKIIGAVLVLAAGVLWVFNGNRTQTSVGPAESTVQAQLTLVAQPTHVPSK